MPKGGCRWWAGSFTVACLLLLLLTGLARAVWIQQGSTVNDRQYDGASPSLAVYNGTPYIAYSEYVMSDQDIFVKFYNGAGWVQVGGSVTTSGSQPHLALSGDTPYVALMDGMRIWVKYYDGSSWNNAGNALNVNTTVSGPAGAPSLCVSNGYPCAAWHEMISFSTNIYVKRYNGTWQLLRDGGVDYIAYGAYDPEIAVNNSGGEAVIYQQSGNIFVKRRSGSNWYMDGGGLCIAGSGANPDLVFINDTPYACWEETTGSYSQIYVKHWNGMDWVQDGQSLNVNANQNATEPDITGCNGSPYLAWQEYDEQNNRNQIYVKYFNGQGWEQLGGGLNVNQQTDAAAPSVAFIGEAPLVAWQEDYIYAKCFFTPTFTVTSTETPTFTPTPTVTRTATATRTPTITPTPTVTATSTISPTCTRTPKSTRTATATETPYFTATATPVWLLPKTVKIFHSRINPRRAELARIYWHQPETGPTTVKIYNMRGEWVATLADQRVFPGGQVQQVNWDGRNDTGQIVANGIYVVLIQSNDLQMRGKLAVMK